MWPASENSIHGTESGKSAIDPDDSVLRGSLDDEPAFVSYWRERRLHHSFLPTPLHCDGAGPADKSCMGDADAMLPFLDVDGGQWGGADLRIVQLHERAHGVHVDDDLPDESIIRLEESAELDALFGIEQSGSCGLFDVPPKE